MGRIAVALTVILWMIPISILVNRIVPGPYMDEIFHVPQAQQYCGGDFRSWDPMITTLPGLYFLSLAYVASLFPGLFCMGAVPSFPDSCTTLVLRLTNGVLAVVCSIIVYEIIVHLRPTLDDKKATFQTVVLSLYPLHWFFTFMYYTDVASLTAVLAMYLLALKNKYLLSSLLGALSVLIRQTNIIWTLFVACTSVIQFVNSHQVDGGEIEDLPGSSMEKDDLSSDQNNVSRSSDLRKQMGDKIVISRNVTPQTSFPMAHSSGLLGEILDILVVSSNHFWELSVTLSPFVMVFLAFIAFVFWNGSIVLGAKDAHAASPHLPQLLYFGLVSVVFTAPAHFSLNRAVALFGQVIEKRRFGSMQWFTASTVGFLSVQFFSIAHPYLLADNRHYPFYLWRRVINYHCSTKYLMLPLYVYSWFSIVDNLAKNQKKIWVLVYFLACAGSLVPAPLIEFRYYTIPFFFLVLHINLTDDKSWVLIGILFLVVNCFTMFMFLYRPFSWEHEGGTQRFIW